MTVFCNDIFPQRLFQIFAVLRFPSPEKVRHEKLSILYVAVTLYYCGTVVVVLRMRHLQAPTSPVVAILVLLSTILPTMLAFSSNVRLIARPKLMSHRCSSRSSSSGSPFLKVSRHRIVTTLAAQSASFSALATSAEEPAGADEEVGCLHSGGPQLSHSCFTQKVKTFCRVTSVLSTDCTIIHSSTVS